MLNTKILLILHCSPFHTERPPSYVLIIRSTFLHPLLSSPRGGATRLKELSTQRSSTEQHLVYVSREQIKNSVIAPGSTFNETIWGKERMIVCAYIHASIYSLHFYSRMTTVHIELASTCLQYNRKSVSYSFHSSYPLHRGTNSC